MDPHTLGQKLILHHHIHCMITCGGLDHQQSRWVSLPNPKFLFPVKAPAKVFRGRLARIKRWNVYAKAPYGSPEQLLKYLAQYTNGAAISNDRILSYNGKQVRFRFQAYRK